jgi:hypothetical protein
MTDRPVWPDVKPAVPIPRDFVGPRSDERKCISLRDFLMYRRRFRTEFGRLRGVVFDSSVNAARHHAIGACNWLKSEIRLPTAEYASSSTTDVRRCTQPHQ